MSVKRMVAGSYDEFVNKVLNAEMAGLNSPVGQEMVAALRAESLKKDPHMSQEKWSRIKQEFMVYVFQQMLDAHPDLKKEFAHHLYEAIKAET